MRQGEEVARTPQRREPVKPSSPVADPTAWGGWPCIPDQGVMTLGLVHWAWRGRCVLCVCVCVCVRVCTYLYMYTCSYVCMRRGTHVCIVTFGRDG